MCFKCGNNDVITIYHKNGNKCAYGSHNTRESEHLHKHCKNCQYDWCENIVGLNKPLKREKKERL